MSAIDASWQGCVVNGTARPVVIDYPPYKKVKIIVATGRTTHTPIIKR